MLFADWGLWRWIKCIVPSSVSRIIILKLAQPLVQNGALRFVSCCFSFFMQEFDTHIFIYLMLMVIIKVFFVGFIVIIKKYTPKTIKWIMFTLRFTRWKSHKIISQYLYFPAPVQKKKKKQRKKIFKRIFVASQHTKTCSIKGGIRIVKKISRKYICNVSNCLLYVMLEANTHTHLFDPMR